MPSNYIKFYSSQLLLLSKSFKKEAILYSQSGKSGKCFTTQQDSSKIFLSVLPLLLILFVKLSYKQTVKVKRKFDFAQGKQPQQQHKTMYYVGKSSIMVISECNEQFGKSHGAGLQQCRSGISMVWFKEEPDTSYKT